MISLHSNSYLMVYYARGYIIPSRFVTEHKECKNIWKISVFMCKDIKKPSAISHCKIKSAVVTRL